MWALTGHSDLAYGHVMDGSIFLPGQNVIGIDWKACTGTVDAINNGSLLSLSLKMATDPCPCMWLVTKLCSLIDIKADKGFLCPQIKFGA